MTEVVSSRGGKPGVSDAFCSALGAADYLLKLASFGCPSESTWRQFRVIRGSLGGHLPGEELTPDGAAIAAEGRFFTRPSPAVREKGLQIQASCFYGMKLAGSLAGGKMRPVSFDQSPVNATAWAADVPEAAKLILVLVNKDARQENCELLFPSAHDARLWRLQAPGLTATSAVTLAGVEINFGKTWDTKEEEHLASKIGELQF